MNTIIKINALGLLMAFIGMGCGETTEVDIGSEGQSTSHTDTAFVQEYHKGFVVHKEIPAANDVRAIHLAPDQNVWIATGNGVYRKPKTGADWEQMLPEENIGPAFALLDGQVSGTNQVTNFAVMVSIFSTPKLAKFLLLFFIEVAYMAL